MRLGKKKTSNTQDAMVINLSMFFTIQSSGSQVQSLNRQTRTITDLVGIAYDPHDDGLLSKEIYDVYSPGSTSLCETKQTSTIVNRTAELFQSISANIGLACPRGQGAQVYSSFNTICFWNPLPQIAYPDPLLILKLLQSNVHYRPMIDQPSPSLPPWLLPPPVSISPQLRESTQRSPPNLKLFTITTQHLAALRSITDVKDLFQPVFTALVAAEVENERYKVQHQQFKKNDHSSKITDGLNNDSTGDSAFDDHVSDYDGDEKSIASYSGVIVIVEQLDQFLRANTASPSTKTRSTGFKSIHHHLSEGDKDSNGEKELRLDTDIFLYFLDILIALQRDQYRGFMSNPPYSVSISLTARSHHHEFLTQFIQEQHEVKKPDVFAAVSNNCDAILSSFDSAGPLSHTTPLSSLLLIVSFGPLLTTLNYDVCNSDESSSALAQEKIKQVKSVIRNCFSTQQHFDAIASRLKQLANGFGVVSATAE